MKIYTKTGDDGTTGLFSGVRTGKDSLRVETYGTVDELNSVVGMAVSAPGIPITLKNDLLFISNNLFRIGSDLATPREPAPKNVPVERINKADIEWLEKKIDSYDNELPPLRNFILPGGTQTAGFIHYARTVCRRAERLAVNLSRSENIGEHVIKYLNRLSDYFFTAARFANKLEGVDDLKWTK